MKCKCSNKKLREMTLAQHAEQWWKEKGEKVPRRDTKAYLKMYEEWVEYAFRDF